MGWQNHYSPKYGRCYVQVSYINRRAKTDRELPLFYDELMDAFEARLLAVCTDASNAGAFMFCRVEGDENRRSDCRACRQFIRDHMDN